MKNLIFSPLILLLIVNSINGAFAQAQSFPNDPLVKKQWALKNDGQVIFKNISDLERLAVTGKSGVDINWVNTDLIPSTKKELIVAVIDSGVDIKHPDLSGRIWFNNKICNPEVSTPNRACNGFNFLDNNTDLTDDVGHGTHVAGIIAANRNTIGVSGASDKRVKIMPIKALNSQVNGFVYNGKVITDVIADAMIFAINNGAEVINLSLGWPKLIDLPKVKKAFDLAEEKNVIVIAGSGNNNKDLPVFPCSYENVICVGAIDNRGDLTDFTNFGAKVDIVAPGESIISTFPQNLESRVLRIDNYESKRGSSQAAPYVTAAVANLKLLFPDLTNDQVRSLLFRSSKKLPNLDGAEKRYVKFGMLDMKALLDLASLESKEVLSAEANSSFINPMLKSLTEIKFKNSDRRFSFSLDLKNLSNNKVTSTACLKALTNSISLDQECFTLDFLENQKIQSIPVKGNVVNLNADSHISFELKIDNRIFKTSLVFSRDISNDSQVLSMPLGKASFEEMAVISGDRRLSRMTRVFDKHKRLNYPEYFYVEKLKQTETQSVVSLLTKKEGSNDQSQFAIKSIALPKVNKVISIHRQDINLDGRLDYFIYTLSNKKDEIIFYLLDENLNPLMKNNVWNFKLSTFEGLPIDNGAEKFEWVKVNNPTFGNIIVPSIYKSYSMPEVDNSKKISERVIGVAPHQFYLNPVLVGDKNDRVEIELRVLDSVRITKSIESKLGIAGSFDTKTLILQKPFPQTDAESRQGILRSLIVVDEDGTGKLHELTWNSLKINSLASENNISQSIQYPIVNSKNGEIKSESIFTALLNRASAEFLIKKESEIGSQSILKESWDNPIISLLATFDNDAKGDLTYLVESRSTVTALGSNNKRSALPVYRESSFPGQSFSETLTPILAEGRPGLYVNSTLIYGERLYSMIETESEGLVRPLGLSISIPVGCIPLLPETLGDKTKAYYSFLCTDSNKEVSMKFLPMSAF